MSQLPAMPVWVADFYSKTFHLTRDERSAYLEILMKTWVRNCAPFADDAKEMALVLGVTVNHWLRLRPKIVPFFDLSGGLWRQENLEKQFAFVQTRKAALQRNGALGGRPKSNNNIEVGKPKGSVLLNPNESTHTHTHSSKQERDDANASSGTQTPAEASDGRSSKRGTRLAVDWQPDEQDCEFAGSLGLGIGLGDVAAEFRDYWIAVPGAKGCKLDWSATFRNRCRDIAKHRTGNGSGRSASAGSTDSPILAALSRVRLKDDPPGYH